MITVQHHRSVSDAATTLLGVRHETPQAILLKDGVPVWNASHFRITAGELKRALASRFRLTESNVQVSGETGAT